MRFKFLLGRTESFMSIINQTNRITPQVSFSPPEMKVVGCSQIVLLLVLAFSFVHCEDCGKSEELLTSARC